MRPTRELSFGEIEHPVPETATVTAVAVFGCVGVQVNVATILPRLFGIRKLKFGAIDPDFAGNGRLSHTVLFVL